MSQVSGATSWGVVVGTAASIGFSVRVGGSTRRTMTTAADPGHPSVRWNAPRRNPLIEGVGARPASSYLGVVSAWKSRAASGRRRSSGLSTSAATADELLEGLAGVLHDAVPHDAADWFGVDPVTMLATAPSRVEGLDAALCDTFWHLEFHEQDTALFADLARGEGAAALRLSLDGQSAAECALPRVHAAAGLRRRAALRLPASTTTRGVSSASTAKACTRRSTRTTSRSCRASARRSRARCARTFAGVTPWLQSTAPGLLVVDRDGQMISANAEAQSWLRELWPMSATRAADVTDLRVCRVR